MVDGPGWRCIGPDADIAAWAKAALPMARDALAGSSDPLHCGGTWAVGLDLLSNDVAGAVVGHPLPWAALNLVPEPLHKAQLSAIYPGYPQPSAAETAAAHAFRLNRDAAHLDGLLAIGPQKSRMIKEPHAWILGIALTDCPASPLVVWEGSHLVLQAALKLALSDHPPHHWGDVDVTHAYQAARAQIFQTCRRVEVPIVMGQATLLHRLTLHGVAPWAAGVACPADGRIIAYFRPQLGNVDDWLMQD